MTKTIIISLLATAAFIVAVGMFMKKGSSFLPSPSSQPSKMTASVSISNKEIDVELAKTKEERIKGLSGRSSLEENEGMLFVFEDETNASVFWMKDMLIPIDIIWINEGKIVRIDKNVAAPAKDTPDEDLKTYSAGKPVDFVLEVNAGFADSNSIKVGDNVIISGI